MDKTAPARRWGRANWKQQHLPPYLGQGTVTFCKAGDSQPGGGGWGGAKEANQKGMNPSRVLRVAEMMLEVVAADKISSRTLGRAQPLSAWDFILEANS